MSKVIAVGNLKGGVGKSTVAVNLACALARPDRPVLLIDADAQGTASAWLTGHQPPRALLSVHVLPIPLMEGDDPEPWIRRVTAVKDRYGVTVVDLPPQVGSGIASALRFADLFLVPVTPLGPDLKATAKALALVQRARAAHGERPTCVLIPSRIDRRTAVGRRATTALDRFGWKIGPTIHQRAAYVEAFGAGKWIGAHSPDSEAHAEFRTLAEAVEPLLQQPVAQPAPATRPHSPASAAAAEWRANAAAAATRQPDRANAAAASVAADTAAAVPAGVRNGPVSRSGHTEVDESRPTARTMRVRPAPAPRLTLGARLGAFFRRLRGFWTHPHSRWAGMAGSRDL